MSVAICAWHPCEENSYMYTDLYITIYFFFFLGYKQIIMVWWLRWKNIRGMSDPLSQRGPPKGKVVNLRVKFLDESVHVFQITVSLKLFFYLLWAHTLSCKVFLDTQIGFQKSGLLSISCTSWNINFLNFFKE